MRRRALDIQGGYHGLGEIQGCGVAPHVRRAHLQGEGSVSKEGGGPCSTAGTPPRPCAGCCRCRRRPTTEATLQPLLGVQTICPMPAERGHGHPELRCAPFGACVWVCTNTGPLASGSSTPSPCCSGGVGIEAAEESQQSRSLGSLVPAGWRGR